MIGNDRIELNNRFVEVFDALVDKGLVVKNDRNGRGMGDFADKILGNRGYGHIIRAFLNTNDKRCFDYKHIDKLCEVYNVNKDYMLYGIGRPFGKTAPRYNSEVSIPQGSNGNIMLTNVHAMANHGISAPTLEDNSVYFSIPDMPGSDLIAFKIEGNSMEPMIRMGDLIVCEPVANVENVKDNDICAVQNNGVVMVKYVQKIYNRRGRVTHLKLISENKLEHDPYTEEVNERTRIYRVMRLISNI